MSKVSLPANSAICAPPTYEKHQALIGQLADERAEKLVLQSRIHRLQERLADTEKQLHRLQKAIRNR